MNISGIFTFLANLSLLSVVVPLGISFFRRKFLNNELKILSYYLILSLMAEIIGYLLAKWNVKNDVVQNLFTLLECTCITYIFYQKFEIVLIRTAIKIYYLLFFSLSIILFLVLGKLDKRDSILITIEAAAFIILAFTYFYIEVRDLNVPRLREHYFFWLNSGFLIYFSATFFIFFFNSFLETCSITIYYYVYGFHLLLSITYNVFLSIGIWKVRPT